MHKKIIIVYFFIFTFLFSLFNLLIFINSYSYNNIHLVYYAQDIKIYNQSSNKVIHINKHSEFIEINVFIKDDKLIIKFSPVPKNIFKKFIISILSNSTIIINNNESISDIINETKRIINEYKYNESFLNMQYKYYLDNFTINVSRIVLTYTVTSTGYSREEPEMGIIPFYTPFIINIKNITKYKPTYFGCPIKKEDIAISMYTINQNLLKYINKKNLYEHRYLPLMFVGIRCKSSTILKRGFSSDIYMRGNYLFSAQNLYIKYGDNIFKFFEVLPSNETIIYLANLHVNYLNNSNIMNIIFIVIVIIVGLIVYIVLKRRG